MHNSAQLRCFENGNDDFFVEAFWIGDAARVGYFVPLNGPLNGHSPSIIYMRTVLIETFGALVVIVILALISFQMTVRPTSGCMPL